MKNGGEEFEWCSGNDFLRAASLRDARFMPGLFVRDFARTRISEYTNLIDGILRHAEIAP
jgi:hypothetical protein